MALISRMHVTIGGTLGTNEVWSVNPVFQLAAGGVPADMDYSSVLAKAQAIADVTIPASLLSLLSTDGKRTFAKVQAWDVLGNLAYSVQASSATTATGTGGPSKSLQDALVLSLRSNEPGPSGRGRLYWPALGCALGSGTFKVVQPSPATILSGTVTYLKAVGLAASGTALPGSTYDLVIRSKARDASFFVQRIMVGDVMDTQRRRRDAQTETYLTATY